MLNNTDLFLPPHWVYIVHTMSLLTQSYIWSRCVINQYKGLEYDSTCYLKTLVEIQLRPDKYNRWSYLIDNIFDPEEQRFDTCPQLEISFFAPFLCTGLITAIFYCPGIFFCSYINLNSVVIVFFNISDPSIRSLAIKKLTAYNEVIFVRNISKNYSIHLLSFKKENFQFSIPKFQLIFLEFNVNK